MSNAAGQEQENVAGRRQTVAAGIVHEIAAVDIIHATPGGDPELFIIDAGHHNIMRLYRRYGGNVTNGRERIH